MANSKTKAGKYFVDTAGAAMVTTETVKIKSIRWEGGTTAGHQAIVQDDQGGVIWQSVASGANYVESELIERWFIGGFKVPTLQSGRLHIETC